MRLPRGEDFPEQGPDGQGASGGFPPLAQGWGTAPLNDPVRRAWKRGESAWLIATCQSSIVPWASAPAPISPLCACSCCVPVKAATPLSSCPSSPLCWKIIRGNEVDSLAFWYTVALSKSAVNMLLQPRK